MKTSKLSSIVVGIALAVLAAGPAEAKSQDPKAPVRYSVRTPNSGIEAGAARTRVQASTDELLQLVTDFDNYTKHISRFEKVKVVGRSGNSVDVYMQVPILKGAAKIWAVVRFAPARESGGERIVEGHMIRGNVDRLDAKWRISRVDDQSSELRLEMLIVPKLPVPGSLVTGEVAYAADKAVAGLRSAAEK